ncbi:hypothetical protein [Fusibacter ferrireducens]|uniref:Uncharacterized protein n=1 Tax=Fusibacter ferrireducens TaxID=2785058 RepID=A0ABS0A110_9FIRM|nr:hypothetical protein [Fusibacter ferrireducens]MBF4695911.1 hypothetical protein [Fusibacter ferrireducens]
MSLLLSNTISLLVLAFAFYLMIRFAKRFQKIDLIFGTLLALFSLFYKKTTSMQCAELGFPFTYVQLCRFESFPSFNFNVIAFVFNAFIWTILIRLCRYITRKIQTFNEEDTQND